MPEFNPLDVIAKIAVLFCVLLAGYYAKKRAFLSDSTPRSLSLFLVNVTQPCMIVSSFDMDYAPEKMRLGLIILACSIGIHLALALIGRGLFARVNAPDENRVFRYAFLFANCSFLGFPILDAIFGRGVGVFYGTFYCIMFNVFNFTYGIRLLRRGRGEKPRWWQAIVNPGVGATIVGILVYLSPWRLPPILYNALSMIGDLTFPLSMVIIGALLASMKPKTLVSDKRLYAFCLCKMIALPLIAIGICKLFSLSGEVPLLCVTMCAVPSATSAAIFAESYQSDSLLAARIVGLSTLCSVVTLPAFILLANAVL